jgi:uncharacterized metal-binding protein
LFSTAGWRAKAAVCWSATAHDLIVMCGTRVEAQRALLFLLTALLANPVLHRRRPGPSSCISRRTARRWTFLGFHRVWWRQPPYQHVLSRAGPLRKAM